MNAHDPILLLREVVLLPGMIARLQLIRPADVAAVEYHLASGRTLIAVAQVDPLEEEVTAAQVTSVGVTVNVLRCVRLGDSTVRVLLEGGGRVAVVGLKEDDDAGLLCDSEPLDDLIDDPDQSALLAEKLRASLAELTASDQGHAGAMSRIADLPEEPGRLADRVAANLTLPFPERLAYLGQPIVEQRLIMALQDIGRELQLQQITTRVSKEVQQRMDQQQREYYLREQIRGLRKELGEIPESHDEATLLEEKLREAGMPEDTLDEALRELDRLRRMHPDAAEYNVSRTWLEWLASMPWATVTTDRSDLRHAAKVLAEDHHGLEKVKERILEYLAVRSLKPDGKVPVLCFLGPPGVGKTSLGRSVARALGREFQRVSLAGMKDEAEIRGHRRTYVGALPGRLIHALKRAGTRNPVIVLDEIDKLGKDFRGDPASALLEVLDPEQNQAFVDHYLDVSFDLSQVLFICTANLAGPIPSALRDRLEITEIPGYILEDKVKIARGHLLPRLREQHGIKDHQLTVTPTAIRHIVEAYTQEAGVRRLEQRLAGIHRKAARRFVEGRKRPMRVDTEDKVAALLGPPRHFAELAERADMPGIAIGLAWTEAGGDILFIEAARYPAAGESLKLTGQLGDVMKESAETALSVIRSRATALGIDTAIFKDHRLHIHVPAGAIPKDGPSAGVTMVTALASLLTGRKVRSYVAMSGELTLRGKVLPVGGVKEKVLAARRAGVREVVLPSRNRVDLEDVPATLRKELTYHFVDTVDQVLALGLEDAPEPTSDPS
jgi:ATP-dependent Lon protease